MNLAHALETHARLQPEKPAIEFGGKSFSYAAFHAMACRIAGALRASGVRRGDLVGLLMNDTPEHLAASFAVMRLGAIVLGMDWRWTPQEVGRAVERFNPKIVMTDDDKRRVDGAAVLPIAQATSAPEDVTPCAEVEHAPFVYAISSGTTGEPKALVLTHENMHARQTGMAAHFPLTADDRFLLAIPVAYGAGRTFALCLLGLGATLVQMPTLFSPQDLARTVNDRNVSALLLPPIVTRSLLSIADGGPLLMPDLRLYISGTADLRPEERRLVRENIARRTLNFYASAATGPITTHQDEDEVAAPQSVGRPLPGAVVEIAGEDGQTLPAGETGRIRLRAATIAAEIVGESGADEGIRDGWYYPGDFGRVDVDGYLYLSGRSADLIKRAGLTVFSAEIESVLLAHSGVQEAAAIGVPSAKAGEDIVAFAVTSGALSERDLLLHCRRNLAPFKVPSQIVLLDALPRNPNGKVLKGELRKRV